MLPSRLPKPAFYLTALFAFLGFVDAAYLTVDHYLKLPLPCSLTNGCDTVLTSPYSVIGPIPVAMFGAAYYLLALLLAVYVYTSEDPALQSARGIWILSGMGVLASAYLIYLQIGVIGALCMYCLISAGISTLLFISSYTLFRQLSRQTKTPAG